MATREGRDVGKGTSLIDRGSKYRQVLEAELAVPDGDADFGSQQSPVVLLAIRPRRTHPLDSCVLEYLPSSCVDPIYSQATPHSSSGKMENGSVVGNGRESGVQGVIAECPEVTTPASKPAQDPHPTNPNMDDPINGDAVKDNSHEQKRCVDESQIDGSTEEKQQEAGELGCYLGSRELGWVRGRGVGGAIWLPHREANFLAISKCIVCDM